MNIKLIIFSGLLTAMAGAVLGVAAAEISNKDSSQVTNPIASRQIDYRYANIGAIMGLIVGVGQEAVRELKNKYEAEMDEDLDELSDWENSLN